MVHRSLLVSTLGAPGTPIDEVARTVVEGGGVGLELRVADGEPVGPDTPPTELEDTARALARTGCRIETVASYIRVAHTATSAEPGSEDDEVVHELRKHVRLAHQLGARFLRVFPGADIEPTTSDQVPRIIGGQDVADATAARRLAAISPVAAEHGVFVLLETHDSHPRGYDIARVLALVDDLSSGRLGAPNIGVIWDILHPWRCGEDPAVTWRFVSRYLHKGRGYVQIKDATARTDTTPALMGAGAIPLQPILDLLDRGGYHGPLALEWERAWYPAIPPLADALAATVAWLAHTAPANSTFRTRASDSGAESRGRGG